jgi:transglutaminase-like putative cysteine protease
LSFNNAQQRLLRFEQLRNRQLTYKLGTTAIVGGVQRSLVPRNPKEATRERAVQLPQDGLPILEKLAKQWIEESGLPKEDRYGRARYLEQKLAGSGLFQYSLTGQERDPTIDPIEDFVGQHRVGHCEYFATALTLMLRSQGIPARLIVGYKCDEWNPTGECFTVRQLHAHTWVEAYLKAAQLPLGLLHGKDYWPWWRDGGWLRLDPTPGGVDKAKESSWLAPARTAMDWLDSSWSTYVMDLDYERQWNAIYGPIVQAAQAAFDAVTDPESWFGVFWRLTALLYLDQLTGVAAYVAYTLIGLLFAGLLALLGWLAWRIGRRIWSRWTGNRHGTARRRTEIEFYRRFEAVLARLGIQRAAGQTQREFAEAAGLQLAELHGDRRFLAAPRVVVEAFYRVRFGREPLDNLASQAVEQAIQEILEVSEVRT